MIKKLRGIICWLKGHHTDPMLFATNSATNTASWFCRDCYSFWDEIENTGRH